MVLSRDFQRPITTTWCPQTWEIYTTWIFLRDVWLTFDGFEAENGITFPTNATELGRPWSKQIDKWQVILFRVCCSTSKIGARMLRYEQRTTRHRRVLQDEWNDDDDDDDDTNAPQTSKIPFTSTRINDTIHGPAVNIVFECNYHE